MNNETINNEIMSLADCIKHADETKELILKKDALLEIPGLLDAFFPPGSDLCLISDENTYKAAGKKVREILEGSGKKILGSHIFPGEPRLHAEYEHVLFLQDWISSLGDIKNIIPVSVGAGTINDLVKCVSTKLGVRYFCVPTAASVDGFTPNGAALLKDGLKQTISCLAPMVLAADTEVISKAPAYLASSGFGDLASKIITGTDWIIAEKAGSVGAPEAPAIDPVCWAMVQNGLMKALTSSVNAANGDENAIATLFQSLAITGFAMQYYKNSRPVSGSEHLFSHVWEMEDLCLDGVPVTHGHKVTIGTLAATAFTEIFFKDPSGPPETPKDYRRPVLSERLNEVSLAFTGSRGHDNIVRIAGGKLVSRKAAELVNQAFRDSWKEIRDKVCERLLPYQELKALLKQAGCPLVPEAIGLERSDIIVTARKAQMMRNKYCVLDLVWDMGCFEKVLSLMEESDSYLR